MVSASGRFMKYCGKPVSGQEYPGGAQSASDLAEVRLPCLLYSSGASHRPYGVEHVGRLQLALIRDCCVRLNCVLGRYFLLSRTNGHQNNGVVINRETTHLFRLMMLTVLRIEGSRHMVVETPVNKRRIDSSFVHSRGTRAGHFGATTP